MASVASQLIEEITAYEQSDSLENAQEICVDGSYFPNNLRIHIYIHIYIYIICNSGAQIWILQMHQISHKTRGGNNALIVPFQKFLADFLVKNKEC